MKFQIITVIVTLTLSPFAKAQGTFFIGQKTYQCTEKFTLKSNLDFLGHDLEIVIVKNGDAGMIALSTPLSTSSVRIKGDALIYLEDRSVLKCVDRGKFDYVDNVATTVYQLTKDEIIKMRGSNLTSIRFSLQCFQCSMSSEEGDFSVSNNQKGYGLARVEKIDIQKLVENLFAN